MKVPQLSVVIPVRNMSDSLAVTLQALSRQEGGQDLEVIVVDDGSTDDTAERVRQLGHPLVRLLQQPHAGPAAARNLGIREARAELVAFLDADVIPEPTWAARILAAFSTDPALAGVEGRTVVPNPEAIDHFSHVMFNQNGGNYPTCNMAFRKAWLERVGGFDPRYRLPWREDSDLAFSILELGGQIRFVPEATVAHPAYPGKPWRVAVTYALRREYDVLLSRRHPRRFRETLGPLADHTELSFLATFIAALAFFGMGWSVAGWIGLLLHQVVYGQVLQRKLSRKPNLHGQDYLQAYLVFWPSTFLVFFALVKGFFKY